MPFDNDPFCGDVHLRAEFDRLIHDYGVRSVVETGTWRGFTALALADMVGAVHTIETDTAKFAEAKERLAPCTNVTAWHGRSEAIVPTIIDGLPRPCLYFLDAHWGADNPLLAELAIIAEHDPKPIIVIHDMQVPGHPELKFDSYGGQAYCYDWVAPALAKIKSPWRHFYNSQATGHQVGVLFVVPA